MEKGCTTDSFEIIKLVVSILTPLSVALLGWLVSRHLKRLELAQWSNQKLIEKRLSIYDEIAPKLNNLLCFYIWVGNWKAISPADIIKLKRELDHTINVYRHLFDEKVYEDYQHYLGLLWQLCT